MHVCAYAHTVSVCLSVCVCCVWPELGPGCGITITIVMHDRDHRDRGHNETIDRVPVCGVSFTYSRTYRVMMWGGHYV